MTAIILFFLFSFLVLAIYLIFNQVRGKGPRFIYIIPERKAMVIEQLGKYNRVLYSGIHFIIPFIERPRRIYWRFSFNPITEEPVPTNQTIEQIDLRDTVYDFPEQTVITSDNAQISIDVFVLLKIRDPHRVVYAVENFPGAIENLTEAGLRNIIGGMALDKTLTSRVYINQQLQDYLRDKTQAWGIVISNVDIKNIRPDEKIIEAMKLQTIAERRKRAAIERGKGEAYMLQAATEVLGSGAEASRYLATVRYVSAFRKLVSQKDGKVVFIPYESGNLLSSLGFMKEFFQQEKAKPIVNPDEINQ